MDIFDSRDVSPMLIQEIREAFDSEEYLYEIKWDGIRCLSYLGKDTDMRNKRNKLMVPLFPELSELHRQVKASCILDHELVVLKNGIPDFFEVQSRALMSNPFKIQLALKKYPASIIAFDILYYKDRELTMLPLTERKKYLEEAVNENNLVSVSRFIETNGTKLYELVKQKNLEGIVAKKKDSLYWPGKRTKDWIKCKVLTADDYVICGYILKDKNFISLVLGQYDENELTYKGHVTMGVSLHKLKEQGMKECSSSPFGFIPKGNEEAKWIVPDIVGIVESMPTEKEYFRQPVFKGFRDDKTPKECTVNREDN